jgi:hypothetical protein
MVDRVELSTTLDTGPVKPGSEVAPKAEDRPTWLPDQFKNAEDLAKSYAELQAAHTKTAQELAGFKKPADQPDQQQQQEQPKTTEEKVADQLQGQGIDVKSMSEKFWETKQIDPEHAKQLSEGLIKAGLASDAAAAAGILDQFSQGQLARAEMHRANISSRIGNEKDSMTAWANANPEAAKMAVEYNKLLDSGRFAEADQAFTQFHTAYTQAVGKDASLRISGGTSQGATGGVYRSSAEMVKDMSDPRYKTDPAFRAMVTDKLGRSSI